MATEIKMPCQWPRNRVRCLRRHCTEKRVDCAGFTVKGDDRIGLQNLEFDAVEELCVQWRRLSMTAVVEDDYPAVRRDYENALWGLISMMMANGRTF